MRGAEHNQSGPLLDNLGVPAMRVLRAGVESRLPERDAFGQFYAHLGHVDGEGPAGAGGVPIKFVEGRVEAELARGVIGDDVRMRTAIEQKVRIADPDSHAVAKTLGRELLRRTVAGDGADL